MGIRLFLQSDGAPSTNVVVRASSPTLLLPMHAGNVEIQVGGRKHLVDKASWVFAPRGTRVALRAKSPATHTLALAIGEELLGAVVQAYDGEIRLTHFERYLSEVQVMARTTWVNELAHRYLFERAVCRKRDNAATTFLEMELVKELYFLCHDRVTAGERASVVEGRSSLVERATALVEAHLFEGDVVQKVMRGCGASPSSILRAFKRELGHSPLSYVRARRLDEALLLLKSRRHPVGEVAAMVGYKSFTAFSEAFRVRFGMVPSRVAGEARESAGR